MRYDATDTWASASGLHVREKEARRRRHMTVGQRAMAVAMMYPEPEKGGKGKLSRIREGLTDNRRTAQNLISYARTVLAHAPKLADQVLLAAS